MVSRLSLLDDTLSLLVVALVHALHHVLDLLQLQPPQVLVLVQGVGQQLLHTAGGRLQASSADPTPSHDAHRSTITGLSFISLLSKLKHNPNFFCLLHLCLSLNLLRLFSRTINLLS